MVRPVCSVDRGVSICFLQQRRALQSKASAVSLSDPQVPPTVAFLGLSAAYKAAAQFVPPRRSVLDHFWSPAELLVSCTLALAGAPMLDCFLCGLSRGLQTLLWCRPCPAFRMTQQLCWRTLMCWFVPTTGCARRLWPCVQAAGQLTLSVGGCCCFTWHPFQQACELAWVECLQPDGCH